MVNYFGVEGMGIDYIVNRQCQLKRHLGKKFLPLVRKQSRYDYFRHKVGETPGFTETTVFDDVYINDQGVVRQSTNLMMMRLELGELVQGGLECFTCGVNCHQTFGGCWGYIGFPISGTVEKLLITTVQSYVKAEQQQGRMARWRTSKAETVSNIVKTMQLTNSQQPVIGSWRQSGLTELAQPLHIKWGPFWQRKTLTTDHILSFLFADNLTASRLQQAAQFLNVFETCVEAGLLAATQNSPKVADYQEQFRHQLLPFKKFTKACLMAAELGEEISIISTN